MYDLELAFMVVAHSQRDPGEYLLELQQWAAIGQVPLRQHALNMHLRRFSQAVRDLVDAGADHFQRAIDLARDKVAPRSPVHFLSCMVASAAWLDWLP